MYGTPICFRRFARSVCSAAATKSGNATILPEGRVPVLVGTRSDVRGPGDHGAVVRGELASATTENASRAQRYGAPAELDFDVEARDRFQQRRGWQKEMPVLERVEEDGLLTVAQSTSARSSIPVTTSGEQVDRDLMPPEGAGEQWRNAKPGSLIDVSSGDCTRTKEVLPITNSETKKLLRDWLACGSPIVKANVPDLPKPIDGTVGDQFPRVRRPQDATFDALFSSVIEPMCVACHAPDNLPDARRNSISAPRKSPTRPS